MCIYVPDCKVSCHKIECSVSNLPSHWEWGGNFTFTLHWKPEDWGWKVRVVPGKTAYGRMYKALSWTVWYIITSIMGRPSTCFHFLSSRHSVQFFVHLGGVAELSHRTFVAFLVDDRADWVSCPSFAQRSLSFGCCEISGFRKLLALGSPRVFICRWVQRNRWE